MRIIIMVLLSFFLMTNLCFATTPDDLGNLLQQYKELSMLFEVGISHQEFSPRYQQLYINTRNLQDKRPEYKEDLDYLFSTYESIDSLWNLYIHKDYWQLNDYMDYYKNLKSKYPNISTSIKLHYDNYNKTYYWLTSDVILYLGNVEVQQQIKAIEAKYN